jgi:hypothetical protein
MTDKTNEFYEILDIRDPLSNAYTREKLFELDSNKWDSVERYILWKYYSDTPKGTAIIKAKNLDEATEIFLSRKISKSKTLSELEENNKNKDIYTSKIKKINLIETLKNAIYAKFDQNILLKIQLSSIEKPIVNKIYTDHFGYTGNILGEILMEYSQYKNRESPKSNNLELSKLNNEFYIVRGNPDNNIINKLRNLGTFQEKNSTKTIYGKYNKELNGWLIPKNKKKELIEILNELIPEKYLCNILIKNWIKKHIKMILNKCKIYSLKIKNNKEISTQIILLITKDFYQLDKYLTDTNKTKIPIEIVLYIDKWCKKYDISISINGINLIWTCVNNWAKNVFNNIENCKEIYKINELKNNENLDLEKEYVFVNVFNRIFELINKNNEARGIPKNCIITLELLLDEPYADKIAKIYKEIIHDKQSGTNLIEKFNLNIGQETEKQLNPILSEKCKLLVLVACNELNKDNMENLEIYKNLKNLITKKD